jgi:CheY-like chemotaxis protein
LSIAGIIDNILEFSKFESDKVKLEHEPFDLGAVVDELEDILTPLTHKKQTELIFDCGSDVPLFLRGDSFRLRQILINLVNNAIKFSNKGGEVIVAARTSQYIAHTSHSQDGPGWVELYFSVTDRGIGIEQEKVADLFKPFSQVQKGNARKFGGSGLGLAICRKLVEAMDGHIFVERTAPGMGTTIAFTVRMQLQAVHGEEGEMMNHRLVSKGDGTSEASNFVLEMSDRKLCLPHIDGTKLRVCILVRNDALSRWLKKTIKGWGAKCKRIKSAKVWQDSGESSDESDDSDSDSSDDSDDGRSKKSRRSRRRPRRNDWMELVKKYHRGWNFDTILADYVIRKRDSGGKATSDNNESDNDFELSGGSGGASRRQTGGIPRSRSNRVLHAVYLINFEERIMIAKQGQHSEIEAASGSSPLLVEHFCPKPIKLRYLFQQLQTISAAVDRSTIDTFVPEKILDAPLPKVRRRQSGSKSSNDNVSPRASRKGNTGGGNNRSEVGQFGQLRALVVEDNKLNQKVIGAMLKRLHIEHDFAENGEEALNVLGEGRHHYEIVFMDIQVCVATPHTLCSLTLTPLALHARSDARDGRPHCGTGDPTQGNAGRAHRPATEDRGPHCLCHEGGPRCLSPSWYASPL